MERAETMMAGTSAAPRRVARGEKTRQDILAVAVQIASADWAFHLFGDKRLFARAAMRRTLEDAATPKGLALLRSKPKARRKTKAKRK